MDIDVNLYAYGNAAANADCARGALVLKNTLMKTSVGKQCHFHKPLEVHNQHQHFHALRDVATLCTTLAHSTEQSVLQQRFFLTLGGDNSASIGSWSGAANALGGDLGLIWFDAHMDSHTFENTTSKNIHGMPLAVLLGHGEKELTHILSEKPKVKPENVVLIGTRSFEKSEAALLKKLGVKIFLMSECKELGMRDVLKQAVDIVTKNTHAFGICVDVDGFDPEDAPGTGIAVKDGVRAHEFVSEFSVITQHSNFIGMEIVEFNPALDVNHKTEKLAMALCHKLK